MCLVLYIYFLLIPWKPFYERYSPYSYSIYHKWCVWKNINTKQNEMWLNSHPQTTFADIPLRNYANDHHRSKQQTINTAVRNCSCRSSNLTTSNINVQKFEMIYEIRTQIYIPLLCALSLSQFFHRWRNECFSVIYESNSKKERLEPTKKGSTNDRRKKTKTHTQTKK